MSKHQATFDSFFSECYLHYKKYITNYIALRICHKYEAEDLAQDVFVRLWEHRAFVNQKTVWSLLLTIARNLITDKLRRHYMREDFVAYIYKVGNTVHNPTEEALNYCELKSMHAGVVESFPAQRRKVYELSFHQEMSSPAIAENLSLSIRTVEGHLWTARKTVRTYLKKEYSEVG